MTLDWKKVAIFVALLATLITLSVLKVVSPEVTSYAVSTVIGWVGGLFTPLKDEKVGLPAATLDAPKP